MLKGGKVSRPLIRESRSVPSPHAFQRQVHTFFIGDKCILHANPGISKRKIAAFGTQSSQRRLLVCVSPTFLSAHRFLLTGGSVLEVNYILIPRSLNVVVNLPIFLELRHGARVQPLFNLRMAIGKGEAPSAAMIEGRQIVKAR